MTTKRFAISYIPFDEDSDQCVSDKPTIVHPTHTSTVEEALKIGHELTRDSVANYFKVVDITVDKSALPKLLQHLID